MKQIGDLEMCVHAHASLQKQVGCFNHRVVTMVANKLKRQWLEMCVHAHASLQKQVGCFNHRVVTMVANKLKRQWL